MDSPITNIYLDKKAMLIIRQIDKTDFAEIQIGEIDSNNKFDYTLNTFTAESNVQKLLEFRTIFKIENNSKQIARYIILVFNIASENYSKAITLINLFDSIGIKSIDNFICNTCHHYILQNTNTTILESDIEKFNKYKECHSLWAL